MVYTKLKPCERQHEDRSCGPGKHDSKEGSLLGLSALRQDDSADLASRNLSSTEPALTLPWKMSFFFSSLWNKDLRQQF